jgi:uncharacterized protein
MTRPIVFGPRAAVGGPFRTTGWRRLSAAIAAGGGAFVTAVGTGVTIRHLVKSGLTWAGVLGIILLVAGLALVSFGWIVLWRASHRWQRLWFVPGVVVALPVMFSAAVGTMLAFGPRTDLGSVTPSDRGMGYVDVTYRSVDGVQLSAWYIPSANRAAIVTVPGAGSSRTAALDQATVLARHGYGVLMVDPRGQGRSGGRAMDAGWYGDRDLTAAVTFLRHRPDVDPTRIGLLGLSMGGEQAIGASAAIDPSIRAVVAEGATHRTAADKAGYLPGGVAGAIQRGLDRITYGTTMLLSPAPQPGTLHRAIVRARFTRFLLIAGGQAVDEDRASAYLRTAAPDRVRVWIVPGASHIHGLATAPSEWVARVTAFFDHVLDTRSTGDAVGGPDR